MVRSIRVLLLSLLGLCFLGSGALGAAGRDQPVLQQVITDAGVIVAVPAGLRAAPGLAALADTPLQVQGLATFTDDAESPLSIQVRRGEAHGWESLPAAEPEVAAEWARRFAAALQVPEAYDFEPGRYEPERSALSVKYKVSGPSFASLMQQLPESHPLWAATIEAGEEPKIARCVLQTLLGGQPAAAEAELIARVPAAAAACSLPEALVSQYLQQLGAPEFAPVVTTVTSLSFFTRLGTVTTLILAPLDRQQAVDEAAALIWNETEVAEGARLPVDSGSALYRWAQLAGIVVGSLLGSIVLGGALAWVLVRLGLRPALAVGSSLGLLCALALTGCLRSGSWQLGGVLQLLSYVLTSALAFRPLVRALSSRRGPPVRRARSQRAARGLTTVEYVVVLVLLAAIGIGAWRLFGGSVQKAVLNSNGQLDGLAKIPLGDGSTGLGSGRDSAAAGGPTPGDRRSSDGPGGGRSSSEQRSGAAPGAGRASVGTGAGRAPQDSGAARSGPESRGSAAQSAVQSAATGAAQGLMPGRAVTPAATPAALPVNAGRVVASEAKEPSLLLRGTDVTTDFVPWVSNAKDAAIAITGTNPVTGEKVGTAGRVMAGVFAIPAAGNVLKYIGKGGKYVLKGGKAAYEAVEAARAASKVAKAAERAAVERAEKEIAQRLEKEAAERLEKEAAARAEKEALERAQKEAAARAEKEAVEAGSEELAKGQGTLIRKVTCFPPGTPVLMADGSTRAIEDVVEGDWIVAADPEVSSATQVAQVIGTTQSQTKRLFSVAFDRDGDGASDGAFQATGEHPIWTQNHGWRDARALELGDVLQSADGAPLEVLSRTVQEGYSRTFNLTVEDVHTFFIVPNGVPILVHNNPRIHGVAPDWATKGAHVTSSNGIEISIHGSGKDVKIGPVFARDVTNPGLKDAIRETEEALNNPSWRSKLLEQTRKATKYLGKGSAVERAGSGGTRALEVTLERWCK